MLLSLSLPSFSFPLSPYLLIKLAKKTQIVFKKEAQVIHAITKHRHSFNTHAKGETSIFFVIKTDVIKYLGVDHAAAHHLKPTRVTTDTTALATTDDALNIDLGRRLGKGEV